MNNSTDKPDVPVDGKTVAELTRLTQGLCLLVVNTVEKKWLSKSDSNETLAYCFHILSHVLETVDEVIFRLRGETLEVNRTDMDSESPTIAAFAAQMKTLGIDNFEIKKGITSETLSGLLGVFCAPPGQIEQLGGFSSAVQAVGIQNVSSKTIVYREVSEDDVVVSKEEFETAKSEFDKSQKVQNRVDNIAEILDLLKAKKNDTQTKKAIEQIQSLATDAQRMAQLVVSAAESKKESAEEEARQNMASALVGCIRNAFETFMKAPSCRTRKGKRELKRNMANLEKEILKILRESSPEEAEECRSAVAGVMEHVNDELQIDMIASEYMKKMKAMRKTEQRLLKYMNTKDVEGLMASPLQLRLSQEGMPIESWQDLMLKSGLRPHFGFGGPEDGAGESGSATLEHLADLLTRMESVVSNLAQHPDTEQREDFTGVLKEMNQEIGQVVTETTEKARRIAREIRDDADAAEESEEEARRKGIGLRLSRKKLLELLAEIVQELFQPLAVINCSIDILLSKRLGEVSEPQADILKLAVDSSEKLRTLIASLLQLSGLPQSLTPDKKTVSQISEESGPPETVRL